MSTTIPSQQLDRVCTLVLARLLAAGKPPPSRSKVMASVRGLIAAVVGAPGDAQLVEAALAHCAERGWAAASPLALTEAGRAELRRRLAVQQLPAVNGWRQVRERLLPALALGVPLQTKGKSAERLAAAIIASVRDVPAANRSLRGVLDTLSWRALGVESEEPFDATRVQRWLLRELVALDVRVDTRTWRRLVAAKLIGAARADASALRDAMLGRWLQGDADVPPPPAAPSPRATATPPSLSSFAAATLRAARLPGVAHFHGDRAFIGSIWEHMRGRPPVGDMTLAEFKETLVQAHRKGLIRMTRADLVGAMDPGEVSRSEARYLNASFHFIALEPEPAL